MGTGEFPQIAFYFHPADTCYPAGSARGSRVVLIVDCFLELALGLAERSSQLRKLCSTEEHKHDDEDDKEFWRTEVHSSRLATLIATRTAGRLNPRL